MASGMKMRSGRMDPTQQQQAAQGGQSTQGQGGQQSQVSLLPQQFSLDINSPYWLGGTNVHNTITIVLLVLIALKVKAVRA